MFEELEHTADLAIRVAAKNLPGLLTESARAVLALSGISLESNPVDERTISLSTGDPESLLVAWLEELLFEIEVNHRAFFEYPIRIDGHYVLTSTLKLAPIESITRMIKAVTFHELSIRTVNDRLETVIVFDV